jgi:integrase/recombinase XerD
MTLALRFADITADGLLIRETKFRKTRLVPLHDTAVAGLERYVVHRGRAGSGNDHVFVGSRGQPLQYQAVQSTFKRLLRTAGLWPAPNGWRPRLHDFRHTFAVQALQASPAGRTTHWPTYGRSGDLVGPRQHLRDILVPRGQGRSSA